MSTLVQQQQQHSPVKMERAGRSSADLLPPSFTRDDVKQHCDFNDCWIIVKEKVYDVTKFLEEHPGGVDIILEYGGGDASAAFCDKGHSGDAFTMLSDYYVGQLKTLEDCISIMHIVDTELKAEGHL